MEFIFGLLKQLATSLSPTQFLGVLGLVVASIFMTIKILVKKKKAGPGLLGFLMGAPAGLTEEESLKEIERKIDHVAELIQHVTTTHSLDAHAGKILDAIAELKNYAIATEQQFDKQYEDIVEIKRDAKDLAEAISKELSDIKHILKMHDNQVHQDSEVTKELQNRMHGILSRMISQLEKIDEFARAAIPEFRGYNKDISKEINNLSRDIALVERSIQNQINTSQSIKLR